MRVRAVGIALLCVSGVSNLGWAQSPSPKLEVVSPKPRDIIATGINERGDVIGFEWVEEKERPGVIEQKPFFARGKEMTYLPLLKGYTATFPAAVSDNGLVVGRVSKPAPPGVSIPYRNLAFLWDAAGGIRSLGVLKDDNASFACGISRDGRRISGFSIGTYRVRACVWDRDADGKTWNGTPLPQKEQLGSNTVALSRNGDFAAAVDGTVPCLWSRDASGQWKQQVLGESASLVPRAVNDQGTVVGVRFGVNGHNRAAVWSRTQGYMLLNLPDGYDRSEAMAINNHGLIVGSLDGPSTSNIDPRAFVFHDGRLRVVNEAGPLFASATAINDKGQIAGVLEEPEPHDDDHHHDAPAPANKPDRK
ncbi:MAG: HAF repeat-containing protein [Isosphaeraceae bacterium]